MLRPLTILFLCPAQPVPVQQSAVKAVAKFGFTAESEDELTLKVPLKLLHFSVEMKHQRFCLFVYLLICLLSVVQVGDIITQVEPVDDQWILGVSGGKRGIVPKNYISLLWRGKWPDRNSLWLVVLLLNWCLTPSVRWKKPYSLIDYWTRETGTLRYGLEAGSSWKDTCHLNDSVKLIPFCRFFFFFFFLFELFTESVWIFLGSASWRGSVNASWWEMAEKCLKLQMF